MELAAEPAAAGRSGALPGAGKRNKKEQCRSGVRSELFAKSCLQVDNEVKAGEAKFPV